MSGLGGLGSWRREVRKQLLSTHDEHEEREEGHNPHTFGDGDRMSNQIPLRHAALPRYIVPVVTILFYIHKVKARVSGL